MNSIIRLLQLQFLPRSVDAGLLVLRLWFGVMMFTHGYAKLTGFSGMVAKFPPLFGLPPAAGLGLAVFAEVVCSFLVVIGLYTRFASAMIAVTMTVAFVVAHKASLTPGPGSGELAFIYLGAFLTLLIAGAGRFSLDAKISPAR